MIGSLYQWENSNDIALRISKEQFLSISYKCMSVRISAYTKWWKQIC
jgi:hypothetical protein